MSSHGPNVLDDVEFRLYGSGQGPGCAVLLGGDCAAGAEGGGGAVYGVVVFDPGFCLVGGGDVEQVCPAFYAAGIGAYVVGAYIGAGSISVRAGTARVVPICACGSRSNIKLFGGRCKGRKYEKAGLPYQSRGTHDNCRWLLVVTCLSFLRTSNTNRLKVKDIFQRYMAL